MLKKLYTHDLQPEGWTKDYSVQLLVSKINDIIKEVNRIGLEIPKKRSPCRQLNCWNNLNFECRVNYANCEQAVL